jgi:putative DNA primase/helicase
MSRKRRTVNVLPDPDDAQHHYDTTDSGNALRFVNAYGARLRFVDELGWFVWDGKRFRHDSSGVRVRQMALNHAIGEYKSLMATHKDDYDNSEVRKFRGNKMIHRIRGMIDAARSHPRVHAHAADFDRDPDLINVLNGTLNLRTGDLLPHNPANLITKLADVEYHPDAVCPRFEDFLLKVVPGGQDVVDYLQRWSGYIVCGETIERCFLVLHGTGANGKSTLLNIWSDILGDYAVDCPIEVFLKEKHELHRTYIVRLRGARLVISSETEEGKVIRAARVKLMTGEDEVTGNMMARDPITFRPVMKLVLGVNYLPEIHDLGDGMWDRIRSIQDWPRIEADQRNRRIRAELLSERSGIFSWMVRGYRAWREGSKSGHSGLAEPPFVLDDVARYRKSMDAMNGFFSSRLVLRADARVESDSMRAAYLAWCETEGRAALSAKAFNAWMRTRKRLDLRHKTVDGVTIYSWFGVSLRDDEPTS